MPYGERWYTFKWPPTPGTFSTGHDWYILGGRRGYGPLGPDLRLRARFVGARMRWDDRPERFYDLTSVGAAQAAREIAAFLRVGPGHLANARENIRDVMHYVREMQHYDLIAAQTRPRLNGVTGFQLLDRYRRAFRSAIAALRNAANQFLETPQRTTYLERFGKSPRLDAFKALRNQDVHNIMASMAIGTRIDRNGEATFVTFDSSYLGALGPVLPLDLQWRVPSEAVGEALRELTAIANEVQRS